MTAWLAATSIGTASLAAAAPPARAQDQAQPSGGDPPARVGRLARLSGSVSTHGADATDWTPAVLNFPFVAGDAIWTPPQAQADIEVGSGLITVADQTELDLATLDNQTFVATEPQGALFVDLRGVQPGETYSFNTPRGAVQIATDGEYEILAGDSTTPTRVVVVRGAAQLTGGSLALRAGQGQMAVATGDANSIQGDTEPVPNYDPFLTAMLARNSAPVDAPQVVQGMTGAEGLAQYGSWQSSPDDGEVWYPQVAPDWVPYRDGSWSYVAPWGWTWVDNEPWGFAPFHYGRWAQRDNRWCWVPGEPGGGGYERPVYAPALVDFLVAGAVVGAAAGLLAASLRSGRGDVGWVPLGPREGYVPPYGGSPSYVRALNRGHAWGAPVWGPQAGGGLRNDHNVTIVNNNAHTVFINQRALTVVPAAAMVHSRPISGVAQGFGSPAARGFQQAASVQALRGPLPMQPTAQTRGVTPQVARRFGLAGGSAQPRAPGPAIAAGFRPGAAPALRVNPHPATQPPSYRPGAAPGRGGLAGAEGPAIAPHSPASPAMPAQHTPMARFNGPVMHPQQPVARPAIPYRPLAPRPAAPRPAAPRPAEPRPAEPRPAAPRPAEPTPVELRPAPRPEAPRPMQQHFAPQREAPPRQAAPRPAEHAPERRPPPQG